MFKQFDERVGQRMDAFSARLQQTESKVEAVSKLQEELGRRLAKLENDLDLAKATPANEPPARTAEWDRPNDYTIFVVSAKEEVALLHVQAAIAEWLQAAGYSLDSD
eukprot:972765-Pyramimonas_sp.AAC.1